MNEIKNSLIQYCRDCSCCSFSWPGLVAPKAMPDDLPLPAAVGGEVRGIMTTLLSHLLGRPLRVPATLARSGRRLSRP